MIVGFSTRLSWDWSKILATVVSIALASGIILSLLSWWEVCTRACAEGHKYRIYGLHFEFVGVVFFSFAAILWTLSFEDRRLLIPLKLLISSALGAESYFLYLQHSVIGKWCPMCLAIFACVVLLAAVFAADYYQRVRSENMRRIRNEVGSILTMAIGFLIVFLGVAKAQPAYGDTLGHDTLYFGNQNSNVDVYVFTDWFCPACRKVEPFITRHAPEISQKARLFFIDVPLHSDSMNFLPYNLSFILKEKTKYLKLRQKLEKLSLIDSTPSDIDVEKIAAAVGTKYQQLDYAQIAAGTKFFQETAAKYGIDATPMVVITNPKTRKVTKLSGVKEIKKADFRALIDAAAK